MNVYVEISNGRSNKKGQSDSTLPFSYSEDPYFYLIKDIRFDWEKTSVLSR